ncbi:hypothetical protein VNO77_13982 [Canavalia gladiata]|uniref:Uncharacterized protein n=1 Tax=Canavalia gladiata TaxID=3824 RepID=A0AAN9LXT1_CANGL
MIEEKEKMENKRGRNNSGSVITGARGGNGIAGLLLLGGAFAIAGFMAVTSFATHKNKPKGALPQPNPKPKLQQLSLETNQGLHSLLQQSATPTNDPEVTCDEISHTWSIIQMNPSNLVHTQTSILEKIEPVPDRNCNTETVALSNDISGYEEDRQGSQAQDMGPQDSLKCVESIEKETEDDVVLESGEEEDIISKAILKSKEEPVWPAKQNLREEAKTVTDSDTDDVIVTSEATLIEKANMWVQLKYLPLELHSRELTTWVMPRLLLLVLLLILLLINPYSSPYSQILPSNEF